MYMYVSSLLGEVRYLLWLPDRCHSKLMQRSAACCLSVDAHSGSHRLFRLCFSQMGRVSSIILRNMLSLVWTRVESGFLCSLSDVNCSLGFGMLTFYWTLLFLLSLYLPGTEERTQREAAEKEQELLRQKQREQQQLMEAQEKSNKENLEQLREKLVQERKQLIEEHNMMLEKQLKVGLLIPLVVLVPQVVGEGWRPGHGETP